MREIKFRAWEKEAKVMCSSNEFDSLTIVLDANGAFRQDQFILMQYTGLKDKNGVEIYEGDILDCTFSDGVKGCMVYVKWNFGNLAMIEQDNHIYEVIGNVYEHRHLLA